MKYIAKLVNNQGCVFDIAEFTSIAHIRMWAKNRGETGTYRCMVSNADNDSGVWETVREWTPRNVGEGF